MTTARRARRLIRLAILLLPAGCASLETPSVTLSNLRVADVTLFEQRLLTTLRVQNPNSVDLDIEGSHSTSRSTTSPSPRAWARETSWFPHTARA